MNLWARRTFIRRAAQVSALLFCYCLGCRARASESEAQVRRKLELFDRLPASFDEGLNNLGENYIQQFSSEGDPEVLLKHLEFPAISDDSNVSDQVLVQQFARHLKSRILEDFQNSQVWEHQGWLLSRTEGRVAALRRIRSSAVG